MLRNVARIARPVLTRGVLPAVCKQAKKKMKMLTNYSI